MRTRLEQQAFTVRSGGAYAGSLMLRARTAPPETAQRLARFFRRRYARSDLHLQPVCLLRADLASMRRH